MRNFIVLILLSVGVFGFSQKFSKEEKELILAGDVKTALPIFQTDNEVQHQVLLAQSEEISPKDKNLPILIERMRLALAATGGGVGIAAPQVGINRRVVLVQRFDKPNAPVEYFINPKITWWSELLNKGTEGDLSIETFRGDFYRSYSIRLEYYDLENKKHDEMVEGFTAVIFQHEIDHLFGVLISDKLEKERNESYKTLQFYKKSNSTTR
ncbi:peptide deformylase [Epilithonimonas xixisoli]|uniref:Peptide deformylase-like n=1 Tax=Epilithonimonas xixisoli TaxID=1476462 RepID=A0A4V3H2V7_9FLAO|nr:peptide deformylase [Epilithonimonas xixisoli]TDX86471.1 peptide deformylase [Epilithonimonas xixisoli]